MSTFEKLLIPLIDDHISYDVINTEDFIGVFTEDINSPGLDYIYVAFKYNMKNLRMPASLYACEVMRTINNELWHILKFPRVSVDLKRILKGDYQMISNEGINKIYTFWKPYDTEAACTPFNQTLNKQPYYKVIPEENYVPRPTERILRKDEEVWGITVERR
jgi:hypothetical protein